MGELFFKNNVYWYIGKSGQYYGFSFLPNDSDRLKLFHSDGNNVVSKIVERENIPDETIFWYDFLKNSGIALSASKVNGSDIYRIQDVKSQTSIYFQESRQKYEIRSEKYEVSKKSRAKQKATLKLISAMFKEILTDKYRRRALGLALTSIPAAGGLVYVLSSISNNEQAVLNRELSDREQAVVDKAINNLEILGITDELKKGENADMSVFSKIGYQDADPVAVYAFVMAIRSLPDIDNDTKENAERAFFENLKYNEDFPKTYGSLNFYCILNTGSASMSKFHSQVLSLLDLDRISGCDSTLRVPTVSKTNHAAFSRKLSKVKYV